MLCLGRHRLLNFHRAFSDWASLEQRLFFVEGGGPVEDNGHLRRSTCLRRATIRLRNQEALAIGAYGEIMECVDAAKAPKVKRIEQLARSSPLKCRTGVDGYRHHGH